MMMALAGDEHGGTGRVARRDDRQGKVHAVCRTGANLEEDVFNLVAHSHMSGCRATAISRRRTSRLLERHLNRVTDTCIPEDEAMDGRERRRVEAIRRERRAPVPARVSLSRVAVGTPQRSPRDRPVRQLAARRRAGEPADLRSWLKTRRSATSSPRTASRRSGMCTR